MLAQVDDSFAFRFKCSHKVTNLLSVTSTFTCTSRNILEDPWYELNFCNNHKVWVAVDRQYGIEVTTISTCCKMTALKLIHGKTSNLFLRCHCINITGTSGDISPYMLPLSSFAWWDSLVPWRHCACCPFIGGQNVILIQFKGITPY